MVKFNRLMAGLVIASSAISAFNASAAREDSTSGETDLFTWEYWNDVHDNGAYYPNWSIRFTEAGIASEFTSAQWEYSITYAGADFRSGTANSSWFNAQETASCYLDLGVLNPGEYTLDATVLLAKGEEITRVALPAINWTAPDRSGEPACEIVWDTPEAGAEYATIRYEITVKNVDKTPTEFHVWADAPGNLMKGEAFGQVGVLKVDVKEGSITCWLKGVVTFDDGSTMNVTPNDVATYFEQDTVGVDAVEAADGEAIYFNLQGVRVAAPEHGLYIRVQNNRASKVIL